MSILVAFLLGATSSGVVSVLVIFFEDALKDWWASRSTRRKKLAEERKRKSKVAEDAMRAGEVRILVSYFARHIGGALVGLLLCVLGGVLIVVTVTGTNEVDPSAFNTSSAVVAGVSTVVGAMFVLMRVTHLQRMAVALQADIIAEHAGEPSKDLGKSSS